MQNLYIGYLSMIYGLNMSENIQVPQGWEVKKLREVVEINNTRVLSEQLEPLSISAGIGFVNQTEKFGRDLAGKQYEKYIKIKKYDFAYNKGNSKKYPQGCIYLLKDREHAAIPNVFECFRIKNYNCFYYEQLFISGFLNKQLYRLINAVVRNDGLLNLNSDSPKYGNKSLVTKEQENELKRRKITFSFSYFKQIPNFQIGECSKGWHIGLLERLGALGTMTPQEVLEENRGSIALRCHPIDWSAKNIPIQRKDLDWLPKEILDNETDFPIMQFSITKSTGRIVGYFDRDSSIFHIVLLDPEHNIQPAKKTNYQIQPTTKGLSQYDDLLNKLERIKSIVSDCSDKKCKLHSHISVIEELHDNIVYIGLDNDFYSTYQEILKKIPLQKILENGILVSMDNA